MLSIRLDEALERRLAHLAKVTGRSKTYYAKEALERYLEEMEDIYLTLQRLEKPHASSFLARPVVQAKETMRELEALAGRAPLGTFKELMEWKNADRK